MTLTISPHLEARLRRKVAQENQDTDTVAETLLTMALDWEARDYAEAVEGIRNGIEASAAGRVRPAAEVFADMRAKIAAAR